MSIHYRVIEASTAENLEKKAEELIADNWEPTGGISVCAYSEFYRCSNGEMKHSHYNFCHSQAFVRGIK